MGPDLDTLATALYVTVDDLLVDHPEWAPERPAVGIVPKLSDAELVTLAVIQALLGYTSEARFLRYADAHLGPWFPYLPTRPAYNKRLRRSAGMMQHIFNHLGRVSPSFEDSLWLVDSTPVECGRSRQTAQRSELAGWAEYGYCASHSRYFWGLRLHLVATASGLPILWAPAPAKADERDIALEMLARSGPPWAGQTIIADKRYRRATFEKTLNDAGITLIRPATRTGETPSGTAVPTSVPPDHRVGQQHSQDPVGSRTARRPHQSRCHSTRPATSPSAHSCDLAQPNHQPARTSPIPHRLRPLTTPWN